jgi:hypothetical protein
VSLPFDFQNEEHSEGLASARVRMIQPYAGEDRGMQFPLEKGTEVLLSFIDGDPDRPIIAGAINTTAAPGPVSADNQTESVIQTGGNNKLRMQDKVGEESIILETPKADSCLRMGSPNEALDLGDDGIRLSSSGSIWTEALGKYGNYIAGAPKDDAVLSSSVDYQSNTSVSEMLGFFLDGKYKPSGLLKYIGGDDQLQDALNNAHVHVSSLDTFNTQEGNIYDFGGYWNYNLGNSYAEDHINQKAELNKKRSGTSGTGEVNFPDESLGIMAAVGAFTGIAIGIASGAAAGKGSLAASAAAGSLLGALTGLVVSAVSSGWGMADNAEKRTFGDVIAGPGSGPIKGLGNKVKNSFVNIDKTTGKHANAVFEQDLDKYKGASGEEYPMHTDTTWVSKTFGDSYEYSYGNTLSISHGHTEEHSKGNTYEYSYGGRSEETKFNGKGIMTYRSWSESGESVEESYNPQNGQLTNVQYKNRADFFVDAELTLPTTPTFSAELNIASVQTTAKLSAGVNIDVSVSAGLSTKVAFSIGFAVEIEGNPGWKLELDDGEMVFKGPYTKFNKKAELDGEINKLILQDAKVKLGIGGVSLKEVKADIESVKTAVSTNGLTVFT